MSFNQTSKLIQRNVAILYCIECRFLKSFKDYLSHLNLIIIFQLQRFNRHGYQKFTTPAVDTERDIRVYYGEIPLLPRQQAG